VYYYCVCTVLCSLFLLFSSFFRKPVTSKRGESHVMKLVASILASNSFCHYYRILLYFTAVGSPDYVTTDFVLHF